LRRQGTNVSSDPQGVAILIGRARSGDQLAAGQLLERYRAYLKVIAERHVDGMVAARLDASDLVQRTCLAVLVCIREFVGEDEGAFLAWLRRVHEHHVANAVRDQAYAARRSVHREQRLDDLGVAGPAAEDHRATSPSQRMMDGENAARLARALETLPEDQRTAVRLRYLEGRSLAEIALRLDRSAQAAAGLIKRGLVGLRRELPDAD
jgi:RNA polymerase sigma-70 factor (ECF subfamily)